MAAIAMLAGAEGRRAWRTMVVLGLVAALGLGAALAAAQLARRTSTAYSRLERVSGSPDAIVLATSADASLDDVTALPQVARSWEAVNAIAEIEGDQVVYAGVSAGTDAPPPGLFTPIVVEGRAPRSGAVDELLVSEYAARTSDLRVGDVLTMHLLTRDEVAQFDTGFGTPDGPRLRMRVVGIARGAFGARVNGPRLFSSPAFAARVLDAGNAFPTVFVQLHDRDQLPAFIRGVDRLADARQPRTGAEEFPAFQVLEPGRERPVVAVTARVLVLGLTAFAVLAAVSALLAVGLALRRYRWLRATTDDDALRALGVTRGQRLAAFVLAATPFLAVSTIGALAVGVASGVLEPLGSIRTQEPNPGWHANLGVLALGTLAVALLVIAVAAVAGRRPRRRRARGGGTVGRAIDGLTAAGLPVPMAIGAGYAVSPDTRRGGPPVRGVLLATALAVAGCVGVATYSWSLDRMVDEPDRWGWVADAAVLDVDDAKLAALRGHAGVDAVTVVSEFDVEVEGRRLTGSAQRGPRSLGWTVLEGRAPRGAGEVLLGARLARSIGADVGDRVRMRGADGDPVTLAVVGEGTGPVLGGQFGVGVALHPTDVDRLALTQPFSSALVRVAPDADADAVRASIGRDLELMGPERPPDVDNLAQLGRLPAVLIAFLAVLSVVVLANSLLVTARRRRHELDTLRAVGFVRRQVRGVFVTTSTTTMVIGLVVGTALGWLVGAAGWRFTAHSAYVAGDAVFAVGRLTVLWVVGLVVATIVAVAAARSVIRRSPAAGLRTE